MLPLGLCASVVHAMFFRPTLAPNRGHGAGLLLSLDLPLSPPFYGVTYAQDTSTHRIFFHRDSSRLRLLITCNNPRLPGRPLSTARLRPTLCRPSLVEHTSARPPPKWPEPCRTPHRDPHGPSKNRSPKPPRVTTTRATCTSAGGPPRLAAVSSSEASHKALLM